MLNNVIVAIFEFLLKHLGGAQDQVGRACAPVCPTLATPLVDTDNDHVSSYDQVVRCVLDLTTHCYSGHAVFNCIDYGRGARNGWKTI